MRFLKSTVSPMYVLFIAASALYHIDDIFDLHDISSFTLNTFPLKFANGPSVKYLHRPHCGSLHFETL